MSDATDVRGSTVDVIVADEAAISSLFVAVLAELVAGVVGVSESRPDDVTLERLGSLVVVGKVPVVVASPGVVTPIVAVPLEESEMTSVWPELRVHPGSVAEMAVTSQPMQSVARTVFTID